MADSSIKVVPGHTGRPDVFLPPTINNRVERRCLFTIAVGDKYKWMFDITVPFMRSYCKRYDIDFIVVDDSYRKDEHPCYMKQFINTLWWRYDRVCYVDSDILITPHAPNIFEHTPKDKCGAFRELEYSGHAEMEKRRNQMNIDYMSTYSEAYNQKMKELGLPVVSLPENLGERYYNAGVFICSKETCPHIPPVGGVMQLPTSNHYDQNYFNMMILKHKIPMHDLGYMWNRRRGSKIKTQPNPLDAYFVHYLGLNQKSNLRRDAVMLQNKLRIPNEPESISNARKPSVINPAPIISNSRRRCLFTIAVGAEYKWMFNITLPLMKEYCTKYNLDFFIADDSWRKNEHPCYMKQLINWLLWRYDQVLYMDADILIMPNSPNIFDCVPIGKCGAYQVPEQAEILRKKQSEYLDEYNKRMWLSDREEMTIPEKYMERFYNAGMFLCDRTCNPHRPPVADVMHIHTTTHYDQMYFNLMINGHDIPMVNVPEVWNKSVNKRLHTSSEYLLKDGYFIHYMGNESKKRLPTDYQYLLHRNQKK